MNRRAIVLAVIAALAVPVPAAAAPTPAAKWKAKAAKLKRENRKLVKQVRKQRTTIAGLERGVSDAIQAVPLERFRAVVFTPAASVWPCRDTSTSTDAGKISYWSFSFDSFCEREGVKDEYGGTVYWDLPY